MLFPLECLPATPPKDDHLRTGEILEVGPGLRLAQPSDAAREAGDGALVRIHAGRYVNDVAVWRQNGLHIQGIGGAAELLSTGRVAQDKAIWVFTGRDVTVENVAFRGARSTSFNGAGIRFEGRHLTLRDCLFQDNQMGLLTSHDPDSRVRIEHSEFHRNTVDYRKHGRLGHNIYIGRNARFVLQESYVHDADTGHQVKSRARDNVILYNRVGDESGRASYLIDLPEGGRALIMGNLLHKSAGSENQSAISFAAEYNRDSRGQALYVVHNTLVSDRPRTLLVHNHSVADALVANNLVQGDARALLGPGREMANLVLRDAGLADAAGYDFHLGERSPAHNSGASGLSLPGGDSLSPTRQYRHPHNSEERRAVGPPDIGAYEAKKGTLP
jgi:hypothetical protein